MTNSPPITQAEFAHRYETLLDLAARAHESFSAQAAKRPPYTSLPSGEVRHIECGAKCSYCCHQQVTLTASEVLRIADYVRNLAPEIQAQIAEDIHREFPNVERRGLSDRSNVNIRCPLLGQDANCAVYEARPLSCRAYVSFNKQQCVEGFLSKAEVTMIRSGSLELVKDHIMKQLIDHERTIGLKANTFELIQALHVILTDHQSEIDLVSGGNKFDSAIAKL